jgi:hypothetical protein
MNLFAVIPDDKIDEQTAKVIEFDDISDSIDVRVKRYIANAGSNGFSGSSSEDTSVRIQLPTIPLPGFNGDIGEWVYFRDKFTALITLNTLSLVDDAELLQLSIDTITSLWNAWKERFEVKRVIADEQLLMSQDSASEPQNMINVVIMSLRLIETIDLKLDSLSEMFLVNLLCSLLYAETHKAFQLQLKPSSIPNDPRCLRF